MIDYDNIDFENSIFIILWKYIGNKGEEYDDEENFCGHKTKTTIEHTEVKYNDIKKELEQIRDIPADYGDGVTNSHILAIYHKDSKEVIPICMFSND